MVSLVLLDRFQAEAFILHTMVNGQAVSLSAYGVAAYY